MAKVIKNDLVLDPRFDLDFNIRLFPQGLHAHMGSESSKERQGHEGWPELEEAGHRRPQPLMASLGEEPGGIS